MLIDNDEFDEKNKKSYSEIAEAVEENNTKYLWEYYHGNFVNGRCQGSGV